MSGKWPLVFLDPGPAQSVKVRIYIVSMKRQEPWDIMDMVGADT